MKRAPKPVEISTEMRMVAGETGLTKLRNLPNMMYKEGCFPEQMKKSIFGNLPIFSGTAKSEKHGTISLMSHVTMQALLVIINRTRGKPLNEI